jgi:hypothetical protein
MRLQYISSVGSLSFTSSSSSLTRQITSAPTSKLELLQSHTVSTSEPLQRIINLQSKALTKDEINEYETGSKLELSAWYAYTALIWSLKGTMLCFFSRMTIGTWHNMFVKTVSVLCALSYLAVFLTVIISVEFGVRGRADCV